MLAGCSKCWWRSEWWVAPICGLAQGLIINLDNLREHSEISHSSTRSGETNQQHKILKECVEYLRDTKWLGDIGSLKATGKT
jgi:hypothetical protein